jgi:hypothetical protein
MGQFLRLPKIISAKKPRVLNRQWQLPDKDELQLFFLGKFFESGARSLSSRGDRKLVPEAET